LQESKYCHPANEAEWQHLESALQAVAKNNSATISADLDIHELAQEACSVCTHWNS
jgi:hypothetical protein